MKLDDSESFRSCRSTFGLQELGVPGLPISFELHSLLGVVEGKTPISKSDSTVKASSQKHPLLDPPQNQPKNLSKTPMPQEPLE